MAANELVLIWFFIIGFAVFAYVVLDGFDLGVGVLSFLFRKDHELALAMKTIEPVWDGNETWLIVGGSSLFAAFPLAYSSLLSAFYAPIIAMLLALIFRGTALAYRDHSSVLKPWWERGFCLGSVVAAFAQGVIVGALVQGVTVDEIGGYAGGWFDWLSPFSVFTGLSVVVSYSVLGAAWLHQKTTGPMQAYSYRILKKIYWLLPLVIVVACLWTPTLHSDFSDRWFSWPTMLYLSPIPILSVALTFLLVRAIHQHQEMASFLYALSLFLLSFAGFAASIYPKIIPPDITIFTAASPPQSLTFLLVGVLVLFPVILSYSAYNYWVFRGKVYLDAAEKSR